MIPELDTELPAAGLSLPEYIALLRRRRQIILQALVLILVVGVVITLMTQPVYQATAKLLVEGPSYNLNTVDSSNPLSSLFELSQQQTVDTQVEVLQAAPLLDKVRRQVGPARLSVSEVKDTNVIQVTGEASDPQRAAAAPNRLLQFYIDEDVSQHLSELEAARQFVQAQGHLAHRRLNAAETALKDFKQQYHVADLAKNRDDQIARVTALTDACQTDQTGLAALQSQIAAGRALLTAEPATLSVKLAATNAEIVTLKDQIRALQVQREGMIQPGGYTSRAPQVQAMDAQIAELQRRLAAEPPLSVIQSSSPNATREALRAKLLDMAVQEASLRTQTAATAQDLARARTVVGHYAGLEVALDRLTRRHDDAEAQDKEFADKLTDLTLREKARHAAARIIETAQVPDAPVRPRKAMNVLLAAFLGLAVGVCLALLQDYLDDRINTAADAERLLGLPALGHVPALSATDARLLPQMPGMDPAAESYRILRTNIHFASIDAPLRTLVVTSSDSGEGKTTTAANLGFAMAADGRTVILVDTDLRRPTLHTLLELPTVPGLTDVLLGQAQLDDVLLEHDEMPGLMALTCGSTPPNPSELLGSRTFRALVEQLREKADLVIFDSPPVLAAADAQILASQMDGTVLVLEAGETRKAAAARTLALLRQARANLLGIAYNKMRLLDGSGYSYFPYQNASRPAGVLTTGSAAKRNGNHPGDHE